MTDIIEPKTTGILGMKANASVPRSIAKSFSWRAVGSLDTLLWSYIFSGSFTIAGSIATVEALTKILLYYLHERGWANVKWGRR